MLVIKSSFQRRVLVSNIPLGIRIGDLYQIFSKFGEIVSFYEQAGKIPGLPNSTGFLLFADESSAEQCLQNGKVLLDGFKQYVRVVRYQKGYPLKSHLKEPKEAGKSKHSEAGNSDTVDLNSNGATNQSSRAGGAVGNKGQKGKRESAYELASKGGRIGRFAAGEDGQGLVDKAPAPSNLVEGQVDLAKINKNRKRRLTRKVKKQLKFDNYNPSQRGYWTASRNRTKTLEKIHLENLRFNKPK